MGRRFREDFTSRDDTARQNICGPKRLVTSESGHSACSWGQTACRRGEAHDMCLRAWGQHLLVKRGQARDQLAVRGVLVRSPGERRRPFAGRLCRRRQLRLSGPLACRGCQRQHWPGVHEDFIYGVSVGLCNDAWGHRPQKYNLAARFGCQGYDRLQEQQDQ